MREVGRRFDVGDSRSIPALQWSVSEPLNLYLYGCVKEGCPTGLCFFYAKDHNKVDTPLLIAATVSNKLSSSKGLVIYSDNNIYIGQLVTSKEGFLGASGVGQLVTPEYCYQGEFRMGIPHGYGSFRTPSLQYVGQFVEGRPHGEGIGKSGNEVFIGQVLK